VLANTQHHTHQAKACPDPLPDHGCIIWSMV
jgi:hypothetical protein